MEDEVGGIWVGSDVTWSKSFRNVKELIWVPSGEAISSDHQSLDLVNDGLGCLILFIY